MRNRVKRQSRLYIEALEGRSVPNCSGFGQLMAFDAQNPGTAKNLGQIESVDARTELHGGPGNSGNIHLAQDLTCS